MSETCPLMTLALLPPELESADLDTQVQYRTMTGRPVPMVQTAHRRREHERRAPRRQSPGRSSGAGALADPGLPARQGQLGNLWHGGWLHTGDIATMSAMAG
jgi:fatty-acyl-CoA synthase